MDSKKVKKAITYTAAMAAMCAAIDLLSAYGFKAWDYDTFKDHHYKMDALQESHHHNMTHWNENAKKENESIEKQLAQVQSNHNELQKPIQTLFWGKISNKCPICEGRE